MSRILIEGDGVASRCSALLLRRAGFTARLKATSRPRLPVVMLSDAAVALMRDVFGKADLFGDAPRVIRRIVRWGLHAEEIALDHSAIVVSEEQLLEGLGTPPDGPDDETADWTVHASRPLPREAVDHRFGARFATATPVELRPNAEPAACWMESLHAGWLFLIANAPGSGWMLSVGAPAEELMAQSRVVASRIAGCGTSLETFPSAPRIVSPLCGPGWFACGSAALAFDPICGDGAANAVREAILVSAVIEALARGGDAAALRAHYEARLTAGFRKHLENCLGFYRSGGNGTWWKNEAAAILSGMAFCEGREIANGAPRYRLAGFRLEPLECYT